MSVKWFKLNCRQFVIFGLGVSCLQLYIQNNWVGPPTAVDPQSLLPDCCQPLLQVIDDICTGSHTVVQFGLFPVFTDCMCM